MVLASQPSFEPDPTAPLPAGDWLNLPPAVASAPLAPGTYLTQAQSSAPHGGVKPLRPAKGQTPRARSIDPSQQLTRTPPAARLVQLHAPAAPPAAALAVAPAQPAVVTTFEGGADDGTSIPPDTAAAFSTTHAFNPLNNNIHTFALNNLHAPPTVTTLNAFWGQEGCFDPKVVYDPHTDRFYFVTMSGAASAASSLLIAASTSGDPAQPWSTQAVMVDPAAQGNVWMDYPSIGFTADKITVQVNLFTIANNQFAGSTVYVFDKASLSSGQQVFLQRFVLLNQGAGQAPAITHDAGFADQYLVSSWGGSIGGGPGALAVWLVTGSPANGTAAISRVGFINGTQSWASFPPVGDFAPQSGVPDRVNTGDDRLLSVIFRDRVLHCSHGIGVPAGTATRTAIQWWQATVGTWIATVSRLDDPTGTVFYAFPTMAVNQSGDILIGHAQFSANIHPSAAFLLVTLAGAQSGAVFAAGLNTYVKTFGANRNRWGDYSATQPDPRDGTSFWTVQEYASAQADTWATRIAHIKPPPTGTV